VHRKSSIAYYFFDGVRYGEALPKNSKAAVSAVAAIRQLGNSAIFNTLSGH
jgi:hypothetical protein